MDSLTTNEAAPVPKPSFFADPKRAQTAFVVVLIFLIIFVLGAGALGYLYWQKNDSYKKLNQTNQEKQQQLDQSNKDKTGLEKQLTDAKKENEDLQNANKESAAEKTNKQTIVKAYTETLTYVASVIDKYQGFDNWTEADYQAGLEIAKKTQSSSYLATVQWAWTRTDIGQMTRFVRFLNETATGINENL